MNQIRGDAQSIDSRIEGDATSDPKVRAKYRRDTSIFEQVPAVVVFPKNAADVSAAVRYVHDERLRGRDISITARSAGTDMTGGPLTSSISLVFTKYMNRFLSQDTTSAKAEPGMYYRDFEKKTLEKGLLMPAFPASREICALGGMVGNNAGGELTLSYGKVDRYVTELDVVLSDGTQTTFKPLTQSELEEKKKAPGLEGDIYRRIDALLEKNSPLIESERPNVSKNSAGYALWQIRDKDKNTFDLSKLIVGSQGTLAITTGIRFSLVRPKTGRAMLIIFLSQIESLPEVVRRVLSHKPEAFESYDDHTFRLALRFFPQIIRHIGIQKSLRLGVSFFSELGMLLRGGVPSMVLIAEFTAETDEDARGAAAAALQDLHDLPLQARLSRNEADAAKYWVIRRESFTLLRKNLKGYYAAPFIDDLVVDPSTYPEFLPALNALLTKYDLIYTIAGHVGSGNFHIIPLINMELPESRRMILELMPKVFELTAQYGGSLTGEHSDGIVRTPYLHLMFSDSMLRLFEETKRIFDPSHILNPGKKVGGTLSNIKDLMLRHS